MTPAERVMQRYQDGEANRAQQAAVQGLLASDADLARRFRQLERLDALLKTRTQHLPRPEVEPLVARVMEHLPAERPRAQATLSLGHVLVAMTAVASVVMAAILADMCRLWLPTEAIAAACALIGLALVVAARPLAHMESSLVAGFLARRLAVGDGEVLVCRALGIALILGAAHIAGLWS